MERQSQGGYSVIEFIFIVALLIVFGLTTFTLLVAGSKAYESISDRKEAQSELRLASSYMAMKIRQGDSAEAVAVVANPFGEGSALRLRETIAGRVFETWIYHQNHQLREVTLEQGIKLESDISFEIAKIDQLTLEAVPGTDLVKIGVTKALRDQQLRYETVIGLKSDGQGRQR